MIKGQLRLRSILFSSISIVLSATSVTLMPTVAVAQEALEEVIVTARKRDESLQEAPIAVSAFSGESLEELGIRNISDLTKVVPNVDMNEGNGTTGAGNVFIRGIGARNTGVNFDSGVGIYLDGVYVGRADGAILDNVDIQSVQVLRGPQGTLFGKNTTGGAILYSTNKPSEEFEGHAEVRAGNYNQLDGNLTVNIPLVGDTLMSRLSIYKTTRDGYVEAVRSIPDASVGKVDPLSLSNDDYSDIDRQGAQAQLRWVATDDLLMDLNYTYSETDQNARGQNCEIVDGIPGSGWQADAQDDFIINPSTGQDIADWCRDNQALGKDHIQAELNPNKYQSETNSLSFTLDWELAENLAFKSITAWRNAEGGEVNELDAIGIPLLGRTNFGWNGTAKRNTDQYSQEFEFRGSAFNDKLDYVVGVFGFYEETDDGTSASPSGPFFGSLFNPNLAFYINTATTVLTENKAASAFSSVDWNFNEYWRLTVGARYTWEERQLERQFRTPVVATLSTSGAVEDRGGNFYLFEDGPDSFNPNHLFAYDFVNDPLAKQDDTIDNSEVTPMMSIQRIFDATGFMDFGTLYFTIANGFMSGGISDTTDINTNEVEEYDPEKVWNYELGFKMDGWDHKLRLNAALFYTDYTDRQLTTIRINPISGRIAGALINADSSQIMGLELESVVIPIPNLQLTLNATFNNGDIDSYDDERIVTPGSLPGADCEPFDIGVPLENCQIDRSDENLPRLPDQVYYAAIQYSWVTDLGEVTPLVQYSYRRNIDNCFDSSSCQSGLYEVDQEDLSARLTWMSPEDSWRVSAYGNNLTDERYITGGTPLVDVTATAGTTYNLPRTYGVEAAYSW
jgi:iron complex outermembrane receptor protein